MVAQFEKRVKMDEPMKTDPLLLCFVPAVPYFRNVAADLVDVLEANNAAKSMLANGDADAADHVALLNFSLEALHKCFLYDVKSDVSKVRLLRNDSLAEIVLFFVEFPCIENVQ
jgi:hypothetical protein